MNETIYQFKGTDDYIVDDDLMLTANIAIKMNKPLLVKGELGQARQLWQSQSPKRWARSLLYGASNLPPKPLTDFISMTWCADSMTASLEMRE